jgi:ABC-type dipeptide/oligopeptide/nickel transport system permease component
MKDSSPIIGDLVEEYREVVLPSRGRVRAALWFARQLASLVRSWMWGALLGFALGAENLVATALWPLAPDTPLLMLTLVSIVLGSLTLIGAAAARQRQRVWDGVVGGAIAALIAVTLVGVANRIRIVMFLDVLQYRDDWIGLMQRFHASGAKDLRTFVAHEYAWSPWGIVGSLIVGAIAGGVGGLSCVRRSPPSRARA